LDGHRQDGDLKSPRERKLGFFHSLRACEKIRRVPSFQVTGKSLILGKGEFFHLLYRSLSRS